MDTLRRWDRAGKLITKRDGRNRRMVPHSEVSRLTSRPERHRTGTGNSTRNRFAGVVRSVEIDGVMALVEMEAGPFLVTAAVTRDSVEELALKPGVDVTALVKATSVMIDGTVDELPEGSVLSSIVASRPALTAVVVTSATLTLGCGSSGPQTTTSQRVTTSAQITARTLRTPTFVGGGTHDEPAYLCPCRKQTREQLAAAIRERGCQAVSEVAESCGTGRECGACKPALAYLVSEINANRHREERAARFINDRVHANIQSDGTFSVVPRMYGGVTTPDQLRRIADAAETYGARMVKVTGGQRIDLLGIRKQDLPAIWHDIGLPSGHAYAKAVRIVKTYVGWDFCRSGLGDSITLGIALEKEWEGLYTPAKVKTGVSGCPRNGAEATVKTFGVVAVGDSWQIRGGGAAGTYVREANVLTTVETAEEVLRVTTALLQYYRENGDYKERLYDFVPRVGLETIKSVVLAEEAAARIRERFRIAKAAVYDPWLERDDPYHPRQFQRARRPARHAQLSKFDDSGEPALVGPPPEGEL